MLLCIFCLYIFVSLILVLLLLSLLSVGCFPFFSFVLLRGKNMKSSGQEGRSDLVGFGRQEKYNQNMLSEKYLNEKNKTFCPMLACL